MASSTRSYTRLLVGGLAEYLAAVGLGSWDDFGEGVPNTGSSEWPIYLGPDVPATPDRLIVLTPGTRSFLRADIVTNIQIRLRGSVGASADEVQDHAERIHQALYPNGFPLAHVTMGELRIGAVFPGDTLPLDRDKNRRHGHIQSFRFRGRYKVAKVTTPDGYGGGDEGGYE